MTRRLLLVDLENVQAADLAQVPEDVQVMVFHGATQKNLPAELVSQAQPLGSRLQWLRISGQGSNALDFHIAFYLGLYLAQSPQCQCVVLSRDKGFDPLMRHLEALGHVCRRVTTLEAAFHPPQRGNQETFNRLIELLRKDKMRPKRRKGLEGRVRAWFATYTKVEQAALIEELLSSGQVVDCGTELIYRLTVSARASTSFLPEF